MVVKDEPQTLNPLPDDSINDEIVAATIFSTHNEYEKLVSRIGIRDCHISTISQSTDASESKNKDETRRQITREWPSNAVASPDLDGGPIPEAPHHPGSRVVSSDGRDESAPDGNDAAAAANTSSTTPKKRQRGRPRKLKKVDIEDDAAKNASSSSIVHQSNRNEPPAAMETLNEAELRNADKLTDKKRSRRSTSKREFRCPSCQKAFVDELSLNRHSILRHPRESDQGGNVDTVVPVCEEEGPTGLTGSSLVVDDRVETLMVPEDYDDDDDAVDTEQTRGQTMSKRKPILKKKSRSSSDTKIKDRKTITPSPSKSPKNKIPCFLCDASFRLKSRLRKHLVDAHPDDQLHCRLCDRDYDNFVKLSQHLKREHKAGPVSLCDWCGMYFVDEEQLVTHAKEVHQQQISTVGCPLCTR